MKDIKATTIWVYTQMVVTRGTFIRTVCRQDLTLLEQKVLLQKAPLGDPVRLY